MGITNNVNKNSGEWGISLRITNKYSQKFKILKILYVLIT
jgi:hypothetical protein